MSYDIDFDNMTRDEALASVVKMRKEFSQTLLTLKLAPPSKERHDLEEFISCRIESCKKLEDKLSNPLANK